MTAKYPKIKTVFLRDPENKYKTLLEGQYALPEFEYLKDNIWAFTEKVNGTNVRVIWTGNRVLYCGRTEKAQMPTFLLAKLQEMFPQELFKELYPEIPMCLYGEGYGARVQKGGGNYIPDGVDFVLFDVLIDNTWLERHNIEDIADKLSIGVVPITGEGILQNAIDMMRDGVRSTWGDFFAEGFVMKPKVELMSRRGHRIITKIKYKDFGG